MNSKINDISKYNNLYFYLALLVIFFAAAYFRLKGLSEPPLAYDEYLFVKSIKNILQYGLPRFNEGGYYVRGLLHQYLSAGLATSGVDVVYAARFISVLSGLSVLPVLYLFGKQLSNRNIALLILVVASFSLWEIEFSRFARMYAMFQSIFIWYAYLLYQIIVQDKVEKLKWLYLLSFISIFVHEATVFLALFNLVPLIWHRKIDFVNVLVVVAILTCVYMYHKIGWRNLGVENAYPHIPAEELSKINLVKDTSGGRFEKPFIFLKYFTLKPIWIVLLFVPVSLLFIGIFRTFYDQGFNIYKKLLFTSVLILSLLNLFGLAIIVSIIIMIIYSVRIFDFSNKTIRSIWIAFVVMGIYWLIYALFETSWHHYYSLFDANQLFKKALVILFKFPNVYERFLILFLNTIPVFTLTSILLLAAYILNLSITRTNHITGQKFIVIILLLNILGLSFIKLPPYSRYMFHLFPLLLTINILSIYEFVKLVRVKTKWYLLMNLLLCALWFYLSEDHEIKYMYHIAKPEYYLRANQTDALKEHYYPREDTEGSAEYINKRLDESDIIISSQVHVKSYLEKLDYIYIDFHDSQFSDLSIQTGRKERWTGSGFIYLYDDLLEILAQNQVNIWFITKRDWLWLEINGFYEQFSDRIVYEGRDGRMIVYKFEKNR